MQPRFPDCLRLPLDFDPEWLAADMAAISGDGWIVHFVRQNYEGDWSVIPMRGPARAIHPVRMIYPDPGCTDFADTPLSAETPYFGEVLAAFACPLQAVRLMRLAPGLVNREHTDLDLAFEQGTVRIHIPVDYQARRRFPAQRGGLPLSGQLDLVSAAVRPPKAWRTESDAIGCTW